MNKVILLPTNSFYLDVLQYIYNFDDNIKEFVYHGNIVSEYYCYRVSKELKKEKLLMPGLCNGEFIFNNKKIEYEHKIHKDKNDTIKTLFINEGSGKDVILTELVLKNDDKDILIELCDESRKMGDNKRKKNKEKSKETIRIYYYNEYWQLLSKRPKRHLETIYLKKGVKENIQNNISTFFDTKTRNEYLSFGIPYKNVCFLYGVPGSGKTSLIDSIASEFSCDVYILPLSGKIDDTLVMSALSSMRNRNEDEEETKKIILIEDIDCIFEDRKEGDCMKNKLTLQGLLNCLDGFTTLEGSLMFITANNPSCLDDALIRSCRVDLKIELGFADKYQTKNMFDVFLPKQKDKFSEFIKFFKNKKYTTAMLQEFLFFNRKCDNILDKLKLFDDIIIKNDSKKMLKDKKETINSEEMYL
jgi:SpoVK/Ycf46/Vps4 family AAA+-type ATPase